jgi:hypothetical protein
LIRGAIPRPPTVSLQIATEKHTKLADHQRRETMAKLLEGRKARVRNLVFVLAGSLVLGYLAITVIGIPIVSAQRPGDTPVVLIGGSVTLGARSSVAGQIWHSITTQKAYFAPGGSAIVAIVVKNADSNNATDRLNIPIPPGASWEIDLFTKEVSGVAVKIQPDSGTPTNIDATAASGVLCPNSANTDLYYSHTTCPAGNAPPPKPADTFDNVVVKINTFTVGTLNCVTLSGAANHCRIVLKT